MALRVALVTPFAWSQPHDVNEHVDGLARELRARGHGVTVLAPSNRARDLAAGRRALAEGAAADFVPLGVEVDPPAGKRRLVVLEWRPSERPLLRALARELAEQPDWELVLLRTRPLGSRPQVLRALRGRMHVRTALGGAARAELLREAAVFVPALEGTPRVELEARAAGAAVASPPGRELQP